MHAFIEKKMPLYYIIKPVLMYTVSANKKRVKQLFVLYFLDIYFYFSKSFYLC